MLWEDEKYRAAVKIQSLVRGHLGRMEVKWLRKCIAAATKLQATWRGYVCKRDYRRFLKVRDAAATCIQKIFRGFAGRRYAAEEKIQRLHAGIVKEKLGKGRPTYANVEPLSLLQAKHRVENGEITKLPTSAGVADLELFFNTSFVLADVQQLNAKDVKLMSEVLVKNQVVKSLMLYGGAIGLQGLNSLFSALKKNSTVRTLGIGNSSISYRGARTISDSLPLTYISSLYLEAVQLTDRCMEIICKTLHKAVALKKLLVSNNLITDEGVMHISRVLPLCEGLEALGLGGNQVKDEGVIALSNALKASGLKSLWLPDNKYITCVGVSHLADLMSTSKHLTELDLTGNMLSDQGAFLLSKALPTSSILILNVSKNSFTDMGAKALLQAAKKSALSPEVEVMGNIVSNTVVEERDRELWDESTQGRVHEWRQEVPNKRLVKIKSPERVKIAPITVKNNNNA
jgi:Ran GTPase-activating protein (RanGAP) involved in mRNA processing and transport